MTRYNIHIHETTKIGDPSGQYIVDIEEIPLGDEPINDLPTHFKPPLFRGQLVAHHQLMVELADALWEWRQDQ